MYFIKGWNRFTNLPFVSEDFACTVDKPEFEDSA